jgi:hypothetical protein
VEVVHSETHVLLMLDRSVFERVRKGKRESSCFNSRNARHLHMSPSSLRYPSLPDDVGGVSIEEMPMQLRPFIYTNMHRVDDSVCSLGVRIRYPQTMVCLINHLHFWDPAVVLHWLIFVCRCLVNSLVRYSKYLLNIITPHR